MNRIIKQTMKQTVENLQKNEITSDELLADRMKNIPKSFIREILKVAISPNIISFAGGLPNPDLFPVDELKQSAAKVFDQMGIYALQYSNSEGYLPLREYISGYYAEKLGIDVKTENILITSGSQQGLDLLGKILLNKGDKVIIEEPGYLGAIQALSLYTPEFLPVKLNSDGMDTIRLERILERSYPKMMYVVPEFQNPSGISYSLLRRKTVAELIRNRSMYVIEDNPYIDLRFNDSQLTSFFHIIPEKTILLGTFSKTIVPGFRIGWIVASDKIMDKLIVAKQAADLHTNVFAQMVLYQYLSDFDNEKHIKKIIKAYGNQCNSMIQAIDSCFPEEVEFTRPEGGMFLWVKLPDRFSSQELFRIVLRKKVAFVPGDPFYTDNRGFYSTFRLNFSCSNEAAIQEGIARIGESIEELSIGIQTQCKNNF